MSLTQDGRHVKKSADQEHLPVVFNDLNGIEDMPRPRSGHHSATRSRRKSYQNNNPGRRARPNVSVKSTTELVPDDKVASPTVLRLKSLALAVRARHSLGIQNPAQRKYLLQASESSTEAMDVGVDLLMEGIQSKLKDDAASSTVGSLHSNKNMSNNHHDMNSELKSKIIFPKEEQGNEERGSSARSQDSSSPAKKPPRPSFKSATMKRGNPTQQMNTIRGDRTSVIKPYDTKPRDFEVTLGPTQNLAARLTCARSLYKLSCKAGNELPIIGGDAITQIADFSDVDDAKLLRYSAAVYVNITTDVSVLEDFTSRDGVSSLLELSWTPLMDVKVACTTALCRLSRNRAHAAVIIRSRAVTELMAMLTVPHVPLQQLVVSCIVNLIFFGHTFPDRVFTGDPQAVQSPLGLINVVSQLSTSPSTSQFAVEALFNLSLHRSSCLGALRGGGAEILYTLVCQICRVVDGSAGGGASSRYLISFGASPPAWAADMNTCLKLLRLAADTLANFSAFVDYQSIMGTHGIKSLSLLLAGALRDVGSYSPTIATEERFRSTAVPCSRALTNFSCNTDLRRQNFSPELIQLVTKLALTDHQRYTQTAIEARVLLRNAVRTLSNLSFESVSMSFVMEMPQVLTLLHAITVLPSIIGAVAVSEYSTCHQAEQQEPQDLRDDWVSSIAESDESSFHDSADEMIGSIALGALSAPAPVWYLRSSRSSHATAFPWTTAMSEDVKEDALIAILNIAQQAVYANELLRTLDGKLLAMAAEDMGHSRRLRYIYASVLCNLLFDTYMQQLIYGDQIARVLVNGFIFFENDTWSHCRRKSDSGEPVSAVSSSTPTTEKDYMQELNLAFDDDKERFLASIYLIASELVDLGNTELIVSLVLPCMQAFRNLVATLPSSGTPSHAQRLQMQQHLPIACYASASLFALTRAATQRRDSHKHFICSEEVETTLIAICGLPSGPGFSVGAGSSGGISSSSRGGVTQAFCAATLYHLCASTSVNQRAIQGLIDCCNANEETQSLLACSAAFAIISFTSEGCWQLVQCENLARALNRLGRTSQVECQQYAAIAACNVSTVRCIWSSPELKDFIVVALLRANSIQAKQIHAKTLSNLLSHGKTRPNVVEDGVLYALMKLSQVMMSGTAAPPTNSIRVERRASLSMDNPAISSSPLSSSTMPSSADEVFSIGLRALFNLSCDHKYHHKLLSNGIMAYLSAAVESKNAASSPNVKDLGKNASNPDSSSVAYLFGAKRSTQKQQPHQSPQSQCCASHLSMESRRFVLAIICNLASYEENHKELMRAQVTEIIRNYADDDIESRASATMALRNLSCRQPWVEMLCERKTLQLLITSTENDHPMVRQFAVEALANCSLVTDSIHMFGDLRVPRAVLALLEITVNIKPSASTPPISVSLELPSEQVDNGVHSSAQALESRETSGKSTCMAALRCLYNIAHDDALALALMEERIVLRMLVLLEYRALGADVSACELAVSIVHTLAGKPRCAEELLGQRSVSVCALLHRRHAESSVIARECVWILMLLSTYQHIQLQLCETQAVAVLVSICNGSALASTNNLEIASRSLRLRECGAVAIRNLTLCVTEHLSLFYERHDDGDGSLRDVGSNSGTILLRLDEPKIVPNNDDGDDPDAEDASVSLLLERHMLQGIKYFQEEVVSGQASDRILLEASAAIANLSTIKVFRVEMVRLGVIPTLLQLMTQPQAKSQRKSLSSPTLSSKSPARLRNTCRGSLLGRICAATLHRLVVEDDAEVDARSQLVPSLLWVLHQTDDELQQVRYECEKISIFTPTNTFGEQGDEAMTSDTSMMGRQFTDIQSRTSTVQEASEVLPQESADSSISTGVGPTNYRQRKHGSVNAILPLPAGAGSAHCVRQSYREQKWMVYVLKTILSSQSMIPQLEKKQLRTLGLPKLCFQDLPPSSFFESPPAPSGSISSRSTASTQCADPDSNSEAPTAGYLLPVNMEKHVIRNLNGVEEIVPVSMAEAASPTRVSSAATVRPIVSGVSGASSGLQPRCHSASPSRTQPEKDPSTIDLGQHGLKFNRQMRLLRRNDRRDLNSLPPV